MIDMQWKIVLSLGKFESLLSEKNLSMNLSPSDLLPVRPSFYSPPKLTLYSLLKKSLLCFVVLGGLYMMVDTISEKILWNSENDSEIYSDCDDDGDFLGHQTFKEAILNVEKNPKEMKLDRSSLKTSMNDKTPKCDLPEIDEKIRSAISKSNAVDVKIKKALDTYDADKLALYDYAAEYAGGEVVSTPETIPYPTNTITQIFGLIRLTHSSSAGEIIKPSTMPGDCFKFYGSKGRIIFKLGKKVSVQSISLEHSPLLEDFSDAPKDFNVNGLEDETGTKKSVLGTFTYNINQASIQTFPVKMSPFFDKQLQFLELEILSNHGNPDYTSIYRFRVHAGRNKETD
ncbi:hypothetical protein HHI36_015784 [Cryptolaemus montrouzieri]|uniref:SUN domain-containing protein n=1 Tax=Cryptolaemus montrouzieri TaxID=559131 RepID=A0ABD2N6M5_9CUCU